VDENGLRKRKRKSTSQIKLLRQELEVQENWSKENIVRMAKLTGLSQSQVYKWFWDQRKKSKAKEVKAGNFRKRVVGKEKKNVDSHEAHIERQLKGLGAIPEEPSQGEKEKESQWRERDTEKKIHKRLFFQ
jgi:hypothetical protein